MTMLFLGKHTDYWLELQRLVEENAGNIPAYEKLLKENATLRAIVRRYELAIEEVSSLKAGL